MRHFSIKIKTFRDVNLCVFDHYCFGFFFFSNRKYSKNRMAQEFFVSISPSQDVLFCMMIFLLFLILTRFFFIYIKIIFSLE